MIINNTQSIKNVLDILKIINARNNSVAINMRLINVLTSQ
jgi:hypothetical protein